MDYGSMLHFLLGGGGQCGQILCASRILPWISLAERVDSEPLTLLPAPLDRETSRGRGLEGSRTITHNPVSKVWRETVLSPTTP